MVGFAGRSDAPDAEVLLSDRRRRYLLYCLHMYANPLRLPDIAHQVTVWERPDSPSVCLRERLETYMSLYHDHLPTLTDADVVEYEQDEDMVELGPAADRLRPSLETRLRRDIDELLGAEGSF
ncbi:DUF7344 domain-containing protein [Haloarcula onubensis]|uniref:DUF7344 domain-containing protein n=1 Tax=Haloarcula onubensis TaxID=2950539 RepID=A0ABU2FQ30_9EURY|nr:hypothetical protein [Halomicroarcula sp. S3CR25-11]MDS0282863.1 hypothetical protein [Halomicroarcula sp. S3CR25-11]